MKKLILTSFILAGALSLCACADTNTSSADSGSAAQSGSSDTASSNFISGMLILMISPSSTNAIGPPTAASGET